MATTQDDPFGAYIEEAAYFDELPDGELGEYLPPFEAGLLMAAGRMLAVCAYRDAAHYADRPFDRGEKDAPATVLRLLPETCDGQGHAFRRDVARAFWDLADDLAAGRAPLPRCQAETWALTTMLDAAPRMCAADDKELAGLGVPIPAGTDQSSYRLPYFEEEAWAFVIEDAKYTIPEAQPPASAEETADDAEEAGAVPEPEGGWDAPVYWFSPYGITRPRDAERGHPAWADTAEQSPAPSGLPSTERAAHLLGLGDDFDPWQAAHSDVLRPRLRTMADILTPLAARLLTVAAEMVAERGWQDLLAHGDRVFARPDDEEEAWELEGSFLFQLPPLCDGQSAAWRLAMVRAVENLADDLRSGRAPLPTCTAEELAFHLILAEAETVLDYLDEDDEYAHEVGLPTGDQFTVRHRTFDEWRQAFLQDEDVLLHYDQNLASIAADPDHPASQQLGTGDLRPRAWFAPFGNIRARSPHPLTDRDRARLTVADPDTFFDSTPALAKLDIPSAETDAATVLPAGLRDEFDHFTGLAQRRFFDEPCAIAMAASLDRLLTRLFDADTVVPFNIWPLNPRASAVKTGFLLVDPDFCLQGYTRTWRLSADRTDREARGWTVALLEDCAKYILANYGQSAMDFLRGGPPAPPLDPQLYDVLPARLHELARDLTTAGLLHHRIRNLGMSSAQLAEEAILPEPLATAWLDGAPVTPSQLLRCAPALQMSEDVLLSALEGKRDTEYWPLPVPPPDQQGRPE
ncbi:hypothetical protein PV416_02185 [Streptomyces ipomoeae]|uniref:hypothetical protein n=1 Tax=Streptomyces ipomoeae TaxID=103232 RepID=UPI0029A42FEF|nr:hypothetical protein [Streptomyces ipomoeae]MDX2819911.1 hypothetical protein [Streptomyces ipomoeae]MDX2872644.1 hypothetical protein [Streptomyces ipomoeae]